MNGYGIGISIISIWETAKLVERKRLVFNIPIEDYFAAAINIDGLRVFELTVPIITDACALPQPFHKDPTDQIIVATSRVLDIPLLTYDEKLLDYSQVKKVTP